MAGRGRGATLPAWMTVPAGAPGASGQDAAGLPTASKLAADTGLCLTVLCLAYILWYIAD